MPAPLKLLTARTIKWNAIDRASSQIIYAVVGVVLANILSQTEFGLVGILLIFQAFATILVDSGFGAALLREKEPDQKDYSTVFWFNLGVSLLIYIILWISAPGIARMFHAPAELIPLSKAMFLVFVINGLSIVQVNRLMKAMDVKMIAVANTAGLIVSGIVGVWLALRGAGAWALVWQNIVLSSVKTLTLWVSTRWWPSLCFSMATLRRIRAVGFSVFSSALLNTISQNIYNFTIGFFFPAASLGVYTQADKWSKMGSASISQILTSSFVPLLSKVQDSPEDFARYVDKAGRFTSFILLPVMMGMAVVASPLFHLLFGNKWDAAIPLFQMLAIRGVFVVYISLYSNYLLALGKARELFISEAVKDGLILLAILSTVFFHNIPLLVAGQLAATLLTWIVLLPLTSRAIGLSIRRLLSHILPFAAVSGAMCLSAVLIVLPLPEILPWLYGSDAGVLSYYSPQAAGLTLRIGGGVLAMALQVMIGIGVYLLLISLLKMPELSEASGYLLGRFRRKK